MSRYYHVSSSLFQVNILKLWALIIFNKMMSYIFYYLKVYKEMLGTQVWKKSCLQNLYL